MSNALPAQNDRPLLGALHQTKAAEKNKKNNTEECFKEQFLPPLLSSFQSPPVIVIVKKNNIRYPFPLSLSSRRACARGEPLESGHCSGWVRGHSPTSVGNWCGRGPGGHFILGGAFHTGGTFYSRVTFHSWVTFHSGVTFLLHGRAAERQRSPGGYPSAQPHCSQLLLVPEQIGAASTKLWPSCCALTPTQHSAQPRGAMSISLQGKTPSEGVVSLLTPHRAQPAPCTFSGSLCSTMSGSGQDLGRCTQNVLLQQVAAETLPHMSASAENSRAG